MARSYFNPGDYNCICDVTGFKMKASQCRLQWNGLFVRKESFEERHPQDFVRGKTDDQSVPIPRSDSEPTFLLTNEVTVDSL